jgi:hypothetical protein
VADTGLCRITSQTMMTATIVRVSSPGVPETTAIPGGGPGMTETIAVPDQAGSDMTNVSTTELIPVELCFDAIRENAHMIPRNAFAVAGYVNGVNTSFIWTSKEWGLFPFAGKLRINVTGSHDKGNVLDVENGDATPDHVASWYDARRKAGEQTLIVYANRSNLTAVNDALAGRKCWRWIATLDGTMRYDNRAMIQFSNSRLAGGPYDVSVIWRRRLALALSSTEQ